MTERKKSVSTSSGQQSWPPSPQGEGKPLWIPRKVGSATRYYRDAAGGYSLRHMMEPAGQGKPQRRKWTLFCGDNRVWDVQPHEMLSAAIEEAEAWLAGR